MRPTRQHRRQIQLENAQPGTSDWRLVMPATNHEIEGYASRTSVGQGERITFYVSTVAPAFNIDIYRMGWYNGDGGRLMRSISGLRGYLQPPAGGLRSPHRVLLASELYPDHPQRSWISGYYLAKLTAETGPQQYVIFVVHDYASTSTYLVQQSITTYEAYNNWGGNSLYGLTGGNEYAIASRGALPFPSIGPTRWAMGPETSSVGKRNSSGGWSRAAMM